MYRLPRDAIDLLDAPYRQVVKIEVHTKDSEFTITEEDILQGGLTIDRYSVSGSKIEIGSAVAGELTLKIKNDDGRFNDVHFEGAELNVQVGVKKWDAHRWEDAQIYWIPCGYFVVDSPPRTLSTISLTALDRMVKFSKEVDASKLSFPMEVEELINRCCTLCGVVCGSDLTKLINRRYVIQELPQTTSEALTYRQLVAWAAEITGTCAYVDWDGQLRFAWYEDTGEVFDGSRRYSSDLYESDVTITGVIFEDDDEAKTQYLAGTADYAFDMSGNGLVQSYFQNVVDAVYVARKGFAYRPYGSNNWSESAMRQFLNSDKAAGSIWTPQTKFDRPPSWVSSLAGWQNGMDADFLKVIGAVTKRTCKNNVNEGGGYTDTKDKFFLLSRTEVFMNPEVSSVDEGAPYDYYKNYSDYMSRNDGADKNRIKYRSSAAQWWWLRTPSTGNASVVRLVSTTGQLSHNSAYGGVSVAPACNII